MTVPKYRYIGVDLLTREIIEDLPLYGVSLTRRISGAGNMTGSYKLGTGDFSDADLLNASVPGLRALFALRNEVCIWAGPIWSRTYQSQAQVISMTGQTFESIFAGIKILTRLEQMGVDQTLLFKYLIDLMQSQPSSNFGIDTSGITPTGVLWAEMVVELYEHKLFSEPIEDMLKASDSFDYVIDYRIDSATEDVELFVKTGYPFLGAGQAGIDLDYPGQVANYYYPESAAQGLVRATVLGQGEGTAMGVATYTNEDLVAAGFPMWETVKSEKSIDNPVQLGRVAQELGLTKKMPVSVPTIEVELGGDEAEESTGIEFAEWGNFGVPINFHIQDVRFPDGKDLRSRMLGWDYHPASSEGTESLKIVLEGQDG